LRSAGCSKNLHPLGERSAGSCLCANLPSFAHCSPLLFELDPEPLQETLTALGGIRWCAGLPLSGAAPEYPGARARETAAAGLRRSDVRGKLCILNAAGASVWKILSACGKTPAGGDDRHACLRARGAGVLAGLSQEEKIAEAQQRRLPEQIAYIRKRRPAGGLGRVNRDLVQASGAHARPAHRHGGSGRDDH